MFEWLSRKIKKAEKPEVLYFKSNSAAFEYALLYMAGPLELNSYIIGQVVEENEPDIPWYLKNTQGDWVINLATQDGIYETRECRSIAEDLFSDLGLEHPPIQPGDLVLVNPASFKPLVYFQIIAKLEPVLDIKNHMFRLSGGHDATILLEALSGTKVERGGRD